MGDLVFDADLLTVVRGVTQPGEDGFELLESGDVTMMVAEVTTVDGTVCLHAGRGATMAFDDMRVNYTCDSLDDAEVVMLMGDFNTEVDVVSVMQGVMTQGNDGWELVSSEAVTLRALVGQADEWGRMNPT